MGLIIIGHATGQHGWSSLESYVNGARAVDQAVHLLQPRAAWGADEVSDDDGLRALLLQGATDPLLLCGFDWHSQPLHRDTAMQDALNGYKGARIGLFQEHLSAPWIREDPALRRLFDEAALSAAALLTHVVCNHEADVQHLRRIGVRLPVVFLPFSADVSVFRCIRPFADRDPRAFFRGKRLDFMGSSPYADREHMLRRLRRSPDAVVGELDPATQSDRARMIERYVSDLNAHCLQLNLPSVSDSMTCRPFEVMACGGLLMQPPIEGDLSQQMLPSSLYVGFPRHDPEALVTTVQEWRAQTQAARAIAQAGHLHVLQHHDHGRRMQQLLGWALRGRSDADTYRDLLGQASAPVFMPAGTPAPAVQEATARPALGQAPSRPCVLVDLVFYQYARSGIAQVWNRLLQEWLGTGLAEHIVLGLRAGALHAPPEHVLQGYVCITLPAHGDADDRKHLQDACDGLQATLFVSTYYSLPLHTRSLLLVHDCIPERLNPDCHRDPTWAGKKAAVAHADGYLCISESTATDLQRFYAVETADKPVYVAHNSFWPQFRPAPTAEVERFKADHGLRGDYLLFVGERHGYLGYKNVETVCAALAQVATLRPDLAGRYTLLFLGGAEFSDALTLEPAIERHLADWALRRISATDAEMAAAYTGATLSIYPSVVEGFGLPPGESLLCGTPALAWTSDINLEIYDGLVPCLHPDKPAGLARQLIAHLDNADGLRQRVPMARQALLDRTQRHGGATQAGTFLECLLLHAQRRLNLEDPGLRPILFDCHPSQRAAWLDRLIRCHPSEITGRGLAFGSEALDSAALVSIYKGADFVVGCLQDLLEQTAFEQGRMEVLLVDSASPGGEFARIADTVRQHRNVFYTRSCERESLYRAWNRGGRYSRARYLSNANLDDRHRIDFFERLGRMLDVEAEVQLVYAAQYLTSQANEPFSTHQPARSWGWPDYSLQQLRIGNHVGSQPMWRRSLHQRIGWFEERYRIAGDYDFWCRIAHEVGPLKLYPAHVGLYYFNGSGIEHGDPLRSELEVAEICSRYGIDKNYSTSEADRQRANASDPQATPARRLEDLQYSGVPLRHDLNVLVPCTRGLDEALEIAESVLGQTVAVHHRLHLRLLHRQGESSQIEAVNAQRLARLSTQLRAVQDAHPAIWPDPKACTLLLTAPAPERDLLESAMQRLYGADTRLLDLQTEGRIVGRIGRTAADLLSEIAP